VNAKKPAGMGGPLSAAVSHPSRRNQQRAIVARAAHELEQLALILADVHKPAERAAALRIASDLRQAVR
jgi:hypothetical protein